MLAEMEGKYRGHGGGANFVIDLTMLVLCPSI